SVLTNQNEIDQAVVVVREARENDSRLVAYIVVNEGVSATTTSIRNLIKNDLPDYMVPQHIVVLDKMPLTPNGKVDKKSLPNAFSDNDSNDQEVVLPTTFSGKKLAKIWSDVLDIDVMNIGVGDNFFDIGGHSLLSMQVIMRIKDATGVKLNPRVIILETLEHVASQCGFTEEAMVSENKETAKKNKSLMKKVFGKVFKNNSKNRAIKR
ncbi:Polyketide synthase modules and related proteins, partial [hydrothermal vent metagenome]